MRRHRLIMSGLMMRAQNRSAEKHRKKQGKLGVSKRGVFEGSAEEGKNGGMEWSKGDGRDVKKFLGTSVAWWEWNRFNFKTNKFLNGLWGRDFGGDLGGVFWSGFWSVGEEWCVGREMMRIIFGGERWRGELGKQIGNGERRTESEERRGGEENGFGGEVGSEGS